MVDQTRSGELKLHLSFNRVLRGCIALGQDGEALEKISQGGYGVSVTQKRLGKHLLGIK